MTENRDPLVCPHCDTVNPWLNEVCRACGEPLSRKANPEEPLSAEKESTPREEPYAGKAGDANPAPSSIPPIFSEAAGPKKRWNVLWMLVGIFLYGVAMVVGEFMIVKWIVAPDPELSSMLEEIQSVAQTTTTDLDDKERDKYRQVLASKSSFVLSLALLALLPPLLAGAVVGYFSERILEGAASMGLAVVLYFLGTGQAVLALVTGPINAGLGAAGSYFGGLLRQRIAARKR